LNMPSDGIVTLFERGEHEQRCECPGIQADICVRILVIKSTICPFLNQHHTIGAGSSN
jgi:hypothetical protein